MKLNMKKKKRFYILLMIAALMILALAGCGTDDIDISGYADEKIVISGVDKEDAVLTISDLKEMECVTLTTESTSDKIGKVRATGPTLDTVLKSLGASQDEFSKVQIYAKDKYDIKLRKEILENNDIILAIGIDGEPLIEEDAPVRVIIPKSDSAYWIRMVEKIELTR